MNSIDAVICTHGLWAHGSGMYLIKRHLEREYGMKGLVFNYPSVTKTLDENAGRLARFIEELKLAIPYEGDTVHFEVERLSIEPFDLEEHVPHDLVIDRLTHWFNPRREWIKKAILLDDVYVFNNPWSVQSMEKLTTYCAMIRLGLPIPRTWLIPPQPKWTASNGPSRPSGTPLSRLCSSVPAVPVATSRWFPKSTSSGEGSKPTTS